MSLFQFNIEEQPDGTYVIKTFNGIPVVATNTFQGKQVVASTANELSLVPGTTHWTISQAGSDADYKYVKARSH